MAPSTSWLLVLGLWAPPPLPQGPAGPLVQSTPPPISVRPPPTEPPTVWQPVAPAEEPSDLEFIDTDAPDAGVPPAPGPKHPLPPTFIRRPQPESRDPPAALARDLDPALETPGCFAWSGAQRTAACIEASSTLQQGGHAALTLIGQADEPYLLWTEATVHAGGAATPGDPVELDAARARLSALDLRALPEPQVMEGPGDLQLEALPQARLRWRRQRLRSEGDPMSGVWEVYRHRIVASCKGRRAHAFALEAPTPTATLQAWVVQTDVRQGGHTLVADFTVGWGIEGDSGRETRAVVIDLDRLCRSPSGTPRDRMERAPARAESNP